jgi:hypothetical protein
VRIAHRLRPIVLATALLGAACSSDDAGDSATDREPPATSTLAPTSTGDAVAAPTEGIVAVCPGEEFVDEPHSVLLARDLPDGGAEAAANAAYEALVAEGLTAEEQAAGFLVPWPDGSGVLRDVTLEGETLTVDFDPAIIDEYVAAPGSSTPFFLPLVHTAFQIPDVEHVVFTIDGQASEWDEWWQGDASRFDRASWRERRPAPEATCPD